MDNTKKELILILQKEPLSSFVDIAKQMNISQPTARRWMDQLFGIDGTIGKKGTRLHDDRTILAINAIPNMPRLELETYSYLIHNDISADFHCFDILQQLGEVHPYTSFLNRFYGGPNGGGTLMQFNVPIGSDKTFSMLMNEIKKQLPILSISSFNRSKVTISTYPDISMYDENGWKFDFTTWLDSTSTNITDYNNNRPTSSFLQKITPDTLILLRELTVDARGMQTEIMHRIIESDHYSAEEKEYFGNHKRRQISRRFELINKNKLISEYRILYDRNVFGIFNQILFIGKFKSKSLASIIQALQHNPLPFRSGFKLLEDNTFFWWINLPISHSTLCMDFLFTHCTKLQIYFLDTKLEHQRSYPLWHKNLIFEKRNNHWRTDFDWIVTKPLEETLP